jgi:hypothetical protein
VYVISHPTFLTGPLAFSRSSVAPRLNTTFRNRPSQTNPRSKLLPIRAFRTPVTGSSVFESNSIAKVDNFGIAGDWDADCRRCHSSHPTTSSLSYEYKLKLNREQNAEYGDALIAYEVEICPIRGVIVIVIVSGLICPGKVVNRNPVDTKSDSTKGEIHPPPLLRSP